MNESKRYRHLIDIVFILALLFGFAICAVMMIALGANIYQKSLDISNENFEMRTAGAYIRQKVRCMDVNGAIDTCKFGDGDAIMLSTDYDSATCITYLYVYEGALMEINAWENVDISPKSGQYIIDMQDMDIEKESDNIFKIFITNSSGDTNVFYINTISKE